jgi:hypothetical protein
VQDRCLALRDRAEQLDGVGVSKQPEVAGSRCSTPYPMVASGVGLGYLPRSRRLPTQSPLLSADGDVVRTAAAKRISDAVTGEALLRGGRIIAELIRAAHTSVLAQCIRGKHAAGAPRETPPPACATDLTRGAIHDAVTLHR